MNAMHAANHPIWPILRLAVMMAALTVILYLNASNFDRTEMQTIIFAFLAGGGVEGFTSLLTRKPSQQTSEGQNV